MRHIVLATLSSVFLAAGCGSGDLSAQDAAAAFAAMSKVAGQGQAQAMADPNALTVEGVYEIDSSLTCGGGGTAEFSGDMELISGDGATFDFDYSFDYAFVACAEGEYVLDGAMTIGGTATTVIDTSVDGPPPFTTTMTFSYSGTLGISGASSGSCAFDLEGTAESNHLGETTMAFSGTICGMTAEEAGLQQ